jgi:drug/metabolite transporter (DMT)-like permease
MLVEPFAGYGRRVNASAPRPAKRRAYIAAAVTVVLWASAFVAIRSAGKDFAPGALALGRLLTASVALGALLVLRREGLPPKAAWPGIVTAGLLWFGGYMVALNWGEREVDAGTAAMVVNVGPILIALFGAWLLKEGLRARVLAGLVVSFAGAVVVGLSTPGNGGSSAFGVALCLVAAVLYAIAVVAQKPALRHASALQVTAFACFVGTLACLPFCGQLASQAAKAPLPATLGVVYLGLLPTAVGFTTWAYALARTSASRMGATTYAVPAVVIAMSWAALGEVPGLVTLAGGVLCLVGVAVSRSRAGAASEPVAPEEKHTLDRARPAETDV